jgi:uncharacterized membrane protein
MAFCANCGAQLNPGTNNCVACGKPAAQAMAGGAAAAPAQVQAGGLEQNVAGMLAYVTIIPAIVFLVLEPYNRNRFIRFHAFQSIFFGVAWTALWIALSFVGAIPVIGWMTLIIWPVMGLGGLIIWILLLMKAYGGQQWKLPVIGDLAEKQANA